MINKKILFIGTGYMGEAILKGVIIKKSSAYTKHSC
jgi:pyrroline-5-carboxylate reductase